MRLLAATANAGKLREIGALLAPHGVEVLGLSSLQNPPIVEEDGATFLENALKKARALHAATGLPSLADDSGLAVEALGGRPGVRSARYAEGGAGDAENNRELLEDMKGVPEGRRAASFVCVMVLVDEKGREHWAEGRLAGTIALAPRGAEGFGYDPLFVPEGGARTLAEFSVEEKNAISHRSRALAAILPRLLALAGEDAP